jgi:menaquinone-dependent protoporphyrinogen oxidase
MWGHPHRCRRIFRTSVAACRGPTASVGSPGVRGEITDDAAAPQRDPQCVTNVLVTYGSKHGSTAEIAEAIADKLREYGLSVDCAPVEDVTSLDRYQAVVLGSALYMGRWQGAPRRFLRRHAAELAARPFWAFSSGPVDGLDPMRPEPPRIAKALEQLGARSHVVFAGRLPTEPRGPLQRRIVKRTPRVYRDERDWGEIRTWAARVAAELLTEPQSPLSNVYRPSV